MARTDNLRIKGVATWMVVALVAFSASLIGTTAGAVEDPTLLSLNPVQTQVVASTATWVEVGATTGALSDLTFEVLPAKGGDPLWRDEVPDVGDVATGEGGVTTFTWRGRYENGKPAPDGAYTLRVVSVPDPLDVCGEDDCTQTRTLPLTVKNYVGKGDRTKPAAPTGLVVVPGANDWMTWTAPSDPDVVSYVVYISSSDSGPWTVIGKTGRNEFEDPVARSGEQWYSVRAKDASGNKSPRSDPASNDVVSVTKTIGPEGGTIATNSKAIKLIIPAGALSSPVTFGITKLEPPTPPEMQVVSGPVFDLTPHGQTFAIAASLVVRLKIPDGYPLAKNFPADTAIMGYFNTDTLSWTKVTGATVDPVAGTVTAPLAHLSSYGPLSAGLPHGNYGTTTNYCGWCHTAHSAPGPGLAPYATQKQTCYQCHNNNQRGSPSVVSGVTWASKTATMTTASAHGINLGDPIWVNGVTPAGYNGQYIAKSVTATTLTYRLDMDPGGAGSGGSVRYGYTAGATTDIVGAFGETTPNNTTKTSYHPVPKTLPGQTPTVKCFDCHSPHKSPTTYDTLLMRQYPAGTYLYSFVGGPKIGTQYCTLGCHDSSSTYPPPYGDHVMTGKPHEGAVPGGVTEVQRVNLALNAGTPAVNEVQQVNINGLANGTPAVNEVQVISLSGGGNNDTYTLNYTDGNGTCTTATIAKNASSATVQSALENATGGCSPSLSGNISVTGSARGPYTVTFQNTLGGVNVQQMTQGPGGTGAITVSVSTTTQGQPAGPGEAFTLTFSGQTTTATLRKGTVTAAQVQSALEALSNIGAGNVSVTGTTGTGPFNVTFVNALGGTNVAQMTGTGLSGGTVTVSTTTQGVPGVPGETFTLTFSGQTTSSLAAGTVTAAQVQAALEALSNIGAGNVVVTGTTGTGPFTVTFANDLANTNVPQMTGTASGGGTVTVTTVTDGVTAANPTGNISCLNCHRPHASDNTHLTSANEESLCFTCHTAANPNTSGGANPPWTGGPFAGTNPYNAFNAKANDTTTGDGNGIRIYHHPIATGEQAGGTRRVECASCHNTHANDRTDSGTTSKASDPAGPTAMNSAWIWGWDFTSGYMSRGTNVNQYCYKCHVSPTTTAPLNAGGNVPYDVRLVNDTANDADGNAHDKFATTQWLTSRHGDPTLDPTKINYPGCAQRGLTGAQCVVTCTNCHDFHGTSNANILRENVVSPDIRLNYNITGITYTSGNPNRINVTIGANTIGSSYQVVITGASPAAYNGVYDVLATGSPTVQLNCINTTTPLCNLASNPGAYTGGGVARVGSWTMTDYNALDNAAGQYMQQAFCRTCHVERGTHNAGKMCTQCHYHGSNKL